MAVFPQGSGNISRRCADTGERATLHQLRRCLTDDYVVWHNVPIGPRARQPDFVVLSPRRGLLILEVKHWAWSTLRSLDRDSVCLETDRGPVTVAHPLAQARGYALELNQVLESDAALCHDEEPFRGKSRVPYGWGCVMSNLRRKNVEGTDFDRVFLPHKTLLREDLDEAVEPYEFEKKLWGMFTLTFPYALSLPQLDRVRWHLFPEIRVQQASLLDEAEPGAPAVLPDLMQVMDFQQEQTARTLGEGHRVIHGAAGSGKTMILIFRAQQLAAAARADKPVLVLCYNRALADRIGSMLKQRGVGADKVVVRTFHAWCQDMVRAYQLARPRAPKGDAYFEELADIVSRSVDTGLVPSGQYMALLIDEAHDFQEAWLRMAARLVSPETQSLLVLYDDAQSIYQKRRRKFSFASVGIQAVGRTSILKLNYRNTAEVLALAMRCAHGLLDGAGDEGADIQTVQPSSAGRRGPLPVFWECSSRPAEMQTVVERIQKALAEGIAPGDIAVLARANWVLDEVGQSLGRRGIACQSRTSAKGGHFDWTHPSVKLVTLHSAKGLEFPLVCIVGLDLLPFKGESLDEEARLLYVGMTRATQRLELFASGASPLVDRVRTSLEAVATAYPPAA